jgi:hypothetical protein
LKRKGEIENSPFAVLLFILLRRFTVKMGNYKDEKGLNLKLFLRWATASQGLTAFACLASSLTGLARCAN